MLVILVSLSAGLVERHIRPNSERDELENLPYIFINRTFYSDQSRTLC